MFINTNSEIPIFIQIAAQIEESIFTGIFQEETQIPSTNEVAMLLQINPHTVLKGMNLLVAEGLIYKRRGVGMFVEQGAVELIVHKRRNEFYDKYVSTLVDEGKKLKMTKEQIVELVERRYEDEGDRS